MTDRNRFLLKKVVPSGTGFLRESGSFDLRRMIAYGTLTYMLFPERTVRVPIWTMAVDCHG